MSTALEVSLIIVAMTEFVLEFIGAAAMSKASD